MLGIDRFEEVAAHMERLSLIRFTLRFGWELSQRC
jgi:hypothetical protein